jgi:ribonucleoside-triphosphate reductase (thioredoxin)
VEAFREALWLLLCGCGVGFSVQKRHIEQLPPLAAANPSAPLEIHVIVDTIEGWADALHELLLAHIAGRKLRFDYSGIRPAGAPLRTSGGKAPGPQPLLHSLTKIESLLAGASGRALKSIEVYDILMWAAKAVLSGGVRRSATICLFSIDDEDMARAKTGDWFTQHPQRSASNNSAVIVRGEATRAQFDHLFEAQKQFGEPGFFFVDDADYGANPCVEIGMNPRIKLTPELIARLRELGHRGELREGETVSGVQFCNLTTLSAAAVEEPEDFHRLCGLASLIGTLQAAYTDFGYLSPVSRLITEREALLGVSICGILDRPNVLLNPQVLERGAAAVKAVNAVVAAALGIHPAARTTCVKPEGTASLLLGTGSGIHPHHAVRYFRRVQANVHDPVFHHFRQTNPQMVEPSVYDQHGRTEVITFPVEGPAFGIYREDLTAVQHLEYVRIVQRHWVQAGRRHEDVSPGLHHNVSCTITVRADEWAEVSDFIWTHRGDFTGVAMLADTGDKCYAQAPLEAVRTGEDILRWNSLVYQEIDYTALIEEEDITELKQVIACAGGACSLV